MYSACEETSSLLDTLVDHLTYLLNISESSNAGSPAYLG